MRTFLSVSIPLLFLTLFEIRPRLLAKMPDTSKSKLESQELQAQLAKTQDELVEAIIKDVKADWLRIVINYELVVENNTFVHNRIGFYFTETKQGITEHEYSFPRVVDKDKPIIKFYESYERLAGKPWNTLNLEIDNNGKYRMTFSYDAPKRLQGIHDAESNDRFKTYLKDHEAELLKLRKH